MFKNITHFLILFCDEIRDLNSLYFIFFLIQRYPKVFQDPLMKSKVLKMNEKFKPPGPPVWYLYLPNPNPNSGGKLPDPPYGTLTYLTLTLTLIYTANYNMNKSFYPNTKIRVTDFDK